MSTGFALPWGHKGNDTSSRPVVSLDRYGGDEILLIKKFYGHWVRISIVSWHGNSEGISDWMMQPKDVNALSSKIALENLFRLICMESTYNGGGIRRLLKNSI
ncbi:hypothetical protein LXL04_007284 [Taraxacum kok-saghyz]